LGFFYKQYYIYLLNGKAIGLSSMLKFSRYLVIILALPVFILSCKKETKHLAGTEKKYRLKSYRNNDYTYFLFYKDGKISTVIGMNSDNQNREQHTYFYQGDKLSRIEVKARAGNADPFHLALVAKYSWSSATELSVNVTRLFPDSSWAAKSIFTFNQAGHLVKDIYYLTADGAYRNESSYTPDGAGNLVKGSVLEYRNYAPVRLSELTTEFDTRPNPLYHVDLLGIGTEQFNANVWQLTSVKPFLRDATVYKPRLEFNQEGLVSAITVNFTNNTRIQRFSYEAF